MTDVFFIWMTGLVPVIISLIAARGIFHLFQLESYQFPGYFRSVKRNPVQVWTPGICAAAASLILLMAFRWVTATAGELQIIFIYILILYVAAIGSGLVIGRILSAKKPKKPFVITHRVKRLYIITAILMEIFSWLLASTHLVWLIALWPLLLPVWIAVCGFIAWGPEKLISEYYFRSARKKLLSQPDLIRIGITGSYGKTSVKHMIGTILSEKYSVLITPKSFNTPMGVARTIRERLLPSHQIFVAEMGARHVGDIKELCRLVKPEIGVLTSVGPQHLDTFRTIERVAKTKYELINALPETGSAFFAEDSGICSQLYSDTRINKTMISRNKGTADVWSENVSVSAEGSSFDLCFAGGTRIQCKTRLLGEHNIQNILMAAAVAKALGLSARQIMRGIHHLQPIPSRMELIENPNSYTIINDGFNSNPISAQAALNVLAQFPKRRIIITPGMVELGAKEEEFNKAFGKAIAEAADIAIIIGKRRVQPIINGLIEAGFSQENMYQVDSLEQSTAILKQFVTEDDTVLYENDLPDNYQEN